MTSKKNATTKPAAPATPVGSLARKDARGHVSAASAKDPRLSDDVPKMYHVQPRNPVVPNETNPRIDSMKHFTTEGRPVDATHPSSAYTAAWGPLPRPTLEGVNAQLIDFPEASIARYHRWTNKKGERICALICTSKAGFQFTLGPEGKSKPLPLDATGRINYLQLEYEPLLLTREEYLACELVIGESFVLVTNFSRVYNRDDVSTHITTSSLSKSLFYVHV